MSGQPNLDTDVDVQTFKEAVEHAGHAIYWTDAEGTIEYVNSAFEEQTGYTAEEAIGRNASILQSGTHEDAFYAALWKTILDGEVWTGEIVNERKDGERYVLKQTITPVTNDAGEIVRFVAVNEEITELRDYQMQLERERDRLGSLLDAIPTPLVLVAFEDNDPIVQRVNHAFADIFGTAEHELIGASIDETIVDTSVSTHSRDINRSLQRGEMVRKEVVRETADGSTRTFLLEAAPVGQDGGEAIGSYIDISDRKRAEAKQQLLTEVSQDIGEAETFIDGLAHALEAICAYTDWAYGEVWQPANDGDSLEFVCGRACAPDGVYGSFVESSESITFQPDEGLPGRVFASGTLESIPDVTEVSTDRFHRRALADAAGLQAALGVPLVTDDGSVIAVLTFFLREYRDIDASLIGDVEDVVTSLDGLVARKQYEQKLKEQRDTLQTLNQVLRHDIRNDLQLIHTSAELATDHVDDDGRDHLATVQECVASAVELTRTTRELAEMLLETDQDTNEIDLAEVLEQQVTEIRASHTDVTIDVEGSIPRTLVTGSEMLGSVFRNLLKNAIQHNDKAHPVVTVAVTKTDDHAEVRIADNGPGIPDSKKAAVFDKGEKGLDSGGTGLGLYLVTSLVETYAGTVWVEDNQPEGAVFVVRLPVAE